MARVFIPHAWRDLTQGTMEVQVNAATLGGAIEELELRFPGLAARACESGELADGLAASIDGAITSRGLLAPLKTDSEVHFIPAIAGG